MVAISLGSIAGFGNKTLKFWLLSFACTVLPDADMIGYHYFFIPYDHLLGHRGFFHSPFFALMVGLLVVGVFFRERGIFTAGWWGLVLYFSLLTVSHGLLDAMTNGGQGIALLSPFMNDRMFLPWKPIEVSPFSVSRFLSERGVTVLKSEMLWIWAPAFIGVLFARTYRFYCQRV